MIHRSAIICLTAMLGLFLGPLSAVKAEKQSTHTRHKKHKKTCPKKNCSFATVTADRVNAGVVNANTVNANSINAHTVKADEVDAGSITVNGCETVRGVAIAESSLEKPCFTFKCNALVNIQDINIDKTLVESPQTLTNPLEALPILTPGSDQSCPDEPSGGDPLVTSIMDQDTSFQLDWLIFTNTSDHATAPVPTPSSGPWYFEKEPFQTSNATVITCGCRELYDPSSLGFSEQYPPLGPNTNSTIEVTFDTAILDPLVEAVALEIEFGYSTEANYDFFTISSGTKTFFQGSGPGPDVDNPYKTGSVTVRVPKTESVKINYLRDPAAYGGVDSVYFTIKKALPLFPIEVPTELVLKRGDTIIKDYSLLIDLDQLDLTELVLDCPISIQAGDQLCLTADPGYYATFNVSAEYQNIPQIKDHRTPERFFAPVEFNSIGYNNRFPTGLSQLQGWYNTDDQFIQNLIYINQVQNCSEGGVPQLALSRYSLASSGPNFVNSYWSGSAPNFFNQIDVNKYQGDLYIYNFDPTTGELRLDPDPENLPGAGDTTYTVFKPVRNTDPRYWQYNFDLVDPEYEFNTPIKFFDFVGEYYKSGFLSSQFGVSSYPTWPDINPLELDQTQYKASFGVSTKAQYDDLLRRLRDIGVERKYGVQRFIYWPYPGSDLTDPQKAALRWVVNQNRYPFLGFVTKLEDEGENTFARLCPGETVYMKGTGTRLDDFPLRLAMDGYHTGPKPGPEFMQTYSGTDPRTDDPIPSDLSYNIYDQWSYYTARLPITIDESNNTIYSRGGGRSRFGEEPFYLDLLVNSNPNLGLGPYSVYSSLFGPNVGLNPIAGNLVIADPIDASTALNNAAQVNGNVVIVVIGSVGSGTIVANATAAGATGVIIVDRVEEPLADFSIGGAGNIPSVAITNSNGMALIDAINGGADVSVNTDLTSPILETVLPTGTYYLSDIYQLLYDKYLAGETEFFIEVGNYISGEYGVDDLFVLSGTAQALLFGPEDPNYPSNFFGPTGIDVGSLWDPTDVPLVAEFQGASENFFDGAYAFLVPGEYKTHTPLTSNEAQALLDALENGTVTVETQHGPITYESTYENYVACINELSMQKGTEDHNIIAPWVHKCDNGLFELPISMQSLLDDLKLIDFDETVTYLAPFNDADDEDSPIPGVPISATFAPTLYCISIRATGTGHPGEFSEMYNAGGDRSSIEDQSRSEGRLEWIVPRNGDILIYPEGTVLPIGDLSGREVEIPIVNYLEDPQWLGFTTNDGAPDYNFIPYVDSTGLGPFADTAVAGSWLIGVMQPEKTREILALGPNDTVPGIGYITWYTSEWSSDGDPSLLPWYDPNFTSVDPGAMVAAARVMQYFNERDVKHIIIDVRNTIGGGEPFWNAFSAVVGGKRYFNVTDATPVVTLEPNGITSVRTTDNFQVAKEEAGVVTYNYQNTILDCNPDAFVAAGLTDYIPGGVWNGEVTGQADLGLTSNIIWLSNATSISNPQYKCLLVKGTSRDQVEYDGDFGRSTQFIEYGVYYRPFSTSGNYDSYINWWTKNRAGAEENPRGLMYGIDRWEAGRSAFMDGNIDGKGGILKGLDQEFSNLHRPMIKWDMNANVFFQDIGYTIGNIGTSVDPVTDGEPWMNDRYTGIAFDDPLTFRDTTLERCVQMVCDPNVASHFYQDDGYGYVSQP
ncbi:MAG: hypothetical protein JSR37_06740 [Verrucomicrobia bacterium]|nr:hypothetical protein [Verrucomicrobiota bacterium]MBS0636879.1 hypothetical protein [Verrucomicrobiota bacterium]